MKKTAYFTISFGIALLIISLYLIFLPFIPLPNQNSQILPEYILRDNGGTIALFSPDSSNPLRTYDIYTRLLPENDVLLLQKGITVTTEEELAKYIEDFEA